MQSTQPNSSATGVPGNVILVGLMGAGKTSVGRVLARHLGKTFVDSDHEIERITGVRIPVIFDIEGEPGFRARERKVIAEILSGNDMVLATGGGAVLDEGSREVMSKRAIVVYLRASVHDLWVRTRNDRNRPLLQTGNPMQKLKELYEVRDPIYRSVAHLTIDTGHQSVASLAGRLEQRLIRYAEETGRGLPLEQAQK